MAIIRKEEVIDSWSALIKDAQGKEGQIFGTTANNIIRSKAPDVSVEKTDFAPGIIRRLIGETRPFILVKETSNSKLKKYQMLIGARDYGNNLDVSWYLLFRPGGFWSQAFDFLMMVPGLGLLLFPIAMAKNLRSVSKEKSGLGLDLFDEQDLRAYVTNAHHCMLDAVNTLMNELNQDPNTIEKKSRGFLGIT